MLQTKRLAFYSSNEGFTKLSFKEKMQSPFFFIRAVYLRCKCYEYFHLVVQIDLLPSFYSTDVLVSIEDISRNIIS